MYDDCDPSEGCIGGTLKHLNISILALLICGCMPEKQEAEEEGSGSSDVQGGDTDAPDSDTGEATEDEVVDQEEPTVPESGPDTDLDGDGITSADGDCDDYSDEVYPGAPEIGGDLLDSDCDGFDGKDADGDGYVSEETGGDDCNDGDASIFPGAEEIFYDDIDQDCLGGSDHDADGDGFDAESAGGTDCDDTDAGAHPDIEHELWYDGTDQNCDGASDYDLDGDGDDAEEYGGSDCDDTDASISSLAEEEYGDGEDNDCDGSIDISVEDCSATLDIVMDDGSQLTFDGCSDITYSPSYYFTASSISLQSFDLTLHGSSDTADSCRIVLHLPQVCESQMEYSLDAGAYLLVETLECSGATGSTLLSDYSSSGTIAYTALDSSPLTETMMNGYVQTTMAGTVDAALSGGTVYGSFGFDLTHLAEQSVSLNDCSGEGGE
jgi:hypothetical protein